MAVVAELCSSRHDWQEREERRERESCSKRKSALCAVIVCVFSGGIICTQCRPTLTPTFSIIL